MNPKTLQTLASKSLCIRVVGEWANANMSTENTFVEKCCCYDYCPEHEEFIRQMYEMQMPSSIVVPKLIHYQIDDYISIILNEVENWVMYHHLRYFFHDGPASSLNAYLIKLIWSPDHSIDYLATAKNILTSSQLNDLEKFRFACTYCLVDEIDKFQKVADVVANWDIETAPLLVYWSKYLKNELDTIQLPEDVAVESFMLEVASKEFGLWPCMEYFFSKLDHNDKLRRFVSFVKFCGKQYRRELLEKLKDKDWIRLCRNSIAEIVQDFASTRDFKDIRYVWRQLDGKVDSKNFSHIIQELVPLSMRNRRNFTTLTPLLIEIWTDVRKDVKNSAMTDRVLRRIGYSCYDIVMQDETFDLNSRHELKEPMKFLRMLLSSYETLQREKFIIANFVWLLLWQPLAVVFQFVKELVGDGYHFVQRLKFEMKYSTRLQTICARLLRFGEFEEFHNIVQFFWFDDHYNVSQESVLYFRKSMVLSNLGLKALSGCLFFHDWQLVHEFVKDMYAHADSASVHMFMSQLVALGVSSAEFLGTSKETCFLMKKISSGELIDFVNFVNAFGQTTETEFRVLKLLSRQTFCQLLFTAEPEVMIFKRTEVRHFLNWNFGSESLAREKFEKPVMWLFPDAFLGQLKTCVNASTFRASDSMEEFLLWCFSNETEIRSFKRDMIYSHCEYERITYYLKQRRYRRRMLLWFFDDDVDLIEKFKNDELPNILTCCNSEEVFDVSD